MELYIYLEKKKIVQVRVGVSQVADSAMKMNFSCLWNVLNCVSVSKSGCFGCQGELADWWDVTPQVRQYTEALTSTC